MTAWWIKCVRLVVLAGIVHVQSSEVEAQTHPSTMGVPQQIEALEQQIRTFQQQVATREETTSAVIRGLQRRVDDLQFALLGPEVLRGFDAGALMGNVLGTFPGTALYTMNIPAAGTYVVVAKMTAGQRWRDGTGVGCRIIAGGDADNSQSVIPNQIADAQGFVIDTASTLTLVTSHTFVQQNELILQCWNNGRDILLLSDIEVLAFKVNAVSVAPLRRLF
jgi:hypothetical protein